MRQTKEVKTEQKEMSKKKKYLLAGGILCIAAVAVIILILVGRGKKEEKAEGIEEYMTINLFPGFEGEDADTVLEGNLTNPEVLLEYAGSYDGIFYEDGENKEKKDIFSLLLTNTAEDTLEVMQLQIEDEKGESYQFQVSALPSGGTVLAQELEGKKFRKDGVDKIVSDNFGFLEENGELSALDIVEQDGKIYVTNNGGSALEGVQIIYKNWLGGHAYPGGIAYRVTPEELPAGETIEITSKHYEEGKSKVTGLKKSAKPVEQADGGTNGKADGEADGKSAD